MKIALYFIFLLCCACTTGMHNRVKLTDAEFNSNLMPTIKEFVKDSGNPGNMKKISRIDFYYAEFESKEVIGMCSFEPLSKSIGIRKSWWDTSSQAGKKVFLYHELGHCVLLKFHSAHKGYVASTESEKAINSLFLNHKKEFSDGCPGSIMYPHMLPEACLQAHYPDYMNDLFGRAK